MMSLKIRKYKKRDEIGFFNLDRELEEHPFNRRSKLNYIWKFNDKNQFGKSISFFATYKKKIIAHFGAIPLGWYLNSKYTLGSCSIAMMVTPEWQSKGLIKFVGDKVFDDLKKNKVDFVYGFPNEKAYLLHKNIWNYKDAFVQNLYLINRKKIIEENNKEFVIAPINKFKKSFDLFWSKNRKDYKNILDRRSSFLNWRYLKRPDDQYKPFFVYQKKKNDRIFYSKKIF